MKCLICKQDSHRAACDQCVQTIRRHLRWIELYNQWLHTTTMLEPVRGTTGRRQPGYQSRPPARLEALVMLDRRSRTDPTELDEDRGIGLDDDTDPAWSILGTLAGLAQRVAEHAGHTRSITGATVAREIGYLLGQLEWTAGQPWITDLAADIHQLHNQARNLCHDRPESCGTCLAVDCTGQVFWMLTRDRSNKARCVACGKTYTGLDLVRLGAQKEVAG